MEWALSRLAEVGTSWPTIVALGYVYMRLKADHHGLSERIARVETRLEAITNSG